MVEQVETMVKSEGVEEKKVFKFKKKNQRNNISSKCVDWDVPELLKGVEFSMGRNGPDLYLKALEKLQLYASTTYKNGVDIQKCLKQEKLTATWTRWECYGYTEGDVENSCQQCYQEKRTTEANLEAMYKVAMSICDPVMKD